MKTERSGLTLVELTISVVVISLIGSVIAGLLFTGLEAYRSGMAQAELQREAAYAMNRMVQYTRDARFVFVPNGRRDDADVLAVLDFEFLCIFRVDFEKRFRIEVFETARAPG